MGDHRYTYLDVFTSRRLEGNGLAVVHDADDLDAGTMLRFAQETRLSETTFVQSPTEEGADYRNRIWDPTRELPFAGHPSLGTAVAVARARGLDEASFVQQTPAGLQPVDVNVDADRASASMLQEPAVIGPEPDVEQVLAAVGLNAGDVDPPLPPCVVSTGVPQVLLPVRDTQALARCRPDYDAVSALLDPYGAIVLYVAVCDPPAATARARAFAHTAAMGEDPATGSAAGPLCAYLAAVADCPALEIDQGIEMGRPSRLRARMDGDRVRVGGDAVVLVDGTVHL